MTSAPNPGWSIRLITIVAGLASVAVGVWAFFDPASFFARLALFPPYNQHLLHDIGAFQIGLGVGLWLALLWADALLVVLAGSAVAATVHVASHVIDRDLGGHPATDIPLLGALALALLVAAVLRFRQLRSI